MKKVHEEFYELLAEKRIVLNKVSTFSDVEVEKSMSSISDHVHEVSTECFPTAVNNIDTGMATILEVAPRRRRKKALRRVLGRFLKVCTCCLPTVYGKKIRFGDSKMHK